MKKFIPLLVFFVIVYHTFSVPVIVQKDNGKPLTTGYSSRPNWDETVLLKPDGPCNVTEIQIYFTGTQAGKDTIYIVGDPSEGAICPTRWIWDYNTKHAPIVVDYNGTPGWCKIPITGLRSDGYDRIVIQHILKANGPWFAIDDNGLGTPYTSFITDESAVYSGGMDAFYIANGDYLVRLVVEYDFPAGNTSALPPAPVLLDINKLSGITNSDGSYIGANDVSIADWNGDGFDDVNLGSNYFQNNGDGTFKNVSSTINIPAGFTSWGDFDNDGKLDVFAAINGAWDENIKTMFTNNKIYKNNGDGTFTALDNKKIFQLPYPNPADDFLTGKTTVNDSIINPYSCVSAVWSDFNNDGKLDLFLANNRVGTKDAQNNDVERYFPDELWLSNPDGTLSNVSKTNGVLATEPYSPSISLGSGYFDCYGANACDYNNDMSPDIFIANYRLLRDELLSNDGNGFFFDVASGVGVKGVMTPSKSASSFGHGMGAEWADFNNDGFPDLLVGNLGHPDVRGYFSNPSLIFMNHGPDQYNFTEMHQQMGLKFYEMNAGVLWADFDLDGWQDIWHGQIAYEAEGTNGAPKRFGRYYLNQGPPDYKLKDATWDLGQGVRVHNCWTAARLDFDHDGDLDILVASGSEGAKLFRNDMKHKGNWLAVRLKGSPADNVNMDAFGSKVVVYAQGKLFYMDLMGSSAGTRGTQNSYELIFGLGNVTAFDSVVVTYPNKKSKVYKNLIPNTRYTLPYMSDPIRNGVATPALTEPANFQIQVPVNFKFKWEPCGFAKTYTIQVSREKSFSTNIIDEANISGTFFDAQVLPANTDLYWRVKASDGTTSSIWSSVWVFSTGVPKPEAPVLILPKKDSLNCTVLPAFQWKNSDYAIPYNNNSVYEIQISDNAYFSSIASSANSLTDSIFTSTTKLKPATKYFWRVHCINGSTTSEWSETWTFWTIALPVKGTLLDPIDKSTNVKVKPTMKWNSFEGANTYHLQIASDNQFTNIFYENEALVNLTVKLFKTMANGTEYFWRVKGINEAGESDWSDVWSLTTEGTKDVEEIPGINSEFSLLVQPNPAIDKVEITFSLPKNDFIEIEVLSVTGSKIESIFSGNLTSGNYKAEWLNKDNGAGLYFIRFCSGNQSISEKVILLR